MFLHSNRKKKKHPTFTRLYIGIISEQIKPPHTYSLSATSLIGKKLPYTERSLDVSKDLKAAKSSVTISPHTLILKAPVALLLLD